MTDENDSCNWNKEALDSMGLEIPDWYLYYTNLAYKIAIEQGLTHVKSTKISLLKTDLWNEGIELQRDILGLYPKCDNLDLYGLDLSRVVCSCARSRLDDVNIVQADIRKLPFRNGAFDIVLDLSTLDHIPETQVEDVINEYKFVLKDEGIIVLIFWYENWIRKLFRKAGRSNKQFYLNLDITKGYLEKNFEIIEEFCIGLPVSIPLFGPFLTCMKSSISKPIINHVLTIEYCSKYFNILKNISGLHVSICRSKK